jgi:hypothetical protein
MPASRTPQRRAFAGLAIGAAGALGVLTAAGIYTEAVRVPDQP